MLLCDGARRRPVVCGGCPGGGICRDSSGAISKGTVDGGGPAERRLRRAVWTYPEPSQAFAALAGWFAVYPALMDGCWLDGEAVLPQPGGFYGGWISSAVQGPFKGDPAHPELI